MGEEVKQEPLNPIIPVISLAELLDGGGRDEIVKKIVEACEEWGACHLVDHGIDIQLLSQMTQLSKQFFALPQAEKLPFKMNPNNKGGFQISSHHKNEPEPNWRELVLFCTYPKEGRDYSRWPDKPAEWKAVTEAYSEKLMELSILMLELLSEGLGLEKDALRNSMVELGQHLVVNHYPKCPEPDQAIGLKRHTDPGSIALLLQDEISGLQITKDNGNTWITVPPIKDSLIFNVGDHVYHMSNGRYKSADHQAIVNSQKVRTSIAVFTHPHKEAQVYPLNLNQGEKPLLLEEPITYGELRRRHDVRYLETVRLKKQAKEENWTKEELDEKLNRVKHLK